MYNVFKKISAYQVRSKVKGHIINNLLTSSVRSLQENLRPRFDLLNSLSLGQYITSVWDFPIMTLLSVNEKFVLSLLKSLHYGYSQKTFGGPGKASTYLPSLVPNTVAHDSEHYCNFCFSEREFVLILWRRFSLEKMSKSVQRIWKKCFKVLSYDSYDMRSSVAIGVALPGH